MIPIQIFPKELRIIPGRAFPALRIVYSQTVNHVLFPCYPNERLVKYFSDSTSLSIFKSVLGITRIISTLMSSISYIIPRAFKKQHSISCRYFDLFLVDIQDWNISEHILGHHFRLQMIFQRLESIFPSLSYWSDLLIVQGQTKALKNYRKGEIVHPSFRNPLKYI